MKKLLTIVLATVLIMSMTIISTADTDKEATIDLKGATITASKSGIDWESYFTYDTGDLDAKPFVNPRGLTRGVELRTVALKNQDNLEGMNDPSLMGLYEVMTDDTPDKFTVAPHINGFDENTTFRLLRFDTDAAPNEWAIIAAPAYDSISNTIVVNVGMNNSENIALIVDKDTLTPTALEPAKSGNEMNYSFLSGIDKNGAKVTAACLKFRGVHESSDFFNTLLEDGLYYTMINRKDKSVEKANLELIDNMLIEVLNASAEYPEYPVNLNITNNDFNKKSKIFVFHTNKPQEGEDPEWEIVTSTAGTDLVIAEFGSLSPVVIYADKTTLGELEEETTPGATTPGATTPESPVTGDGATGYALLIGLMALMGMVILGKKEYNK